MDLSYSFAKPQGEMKMSQTLSFHKTESIVNYMRLMEDRIRQRAYEIFAANRIYGRDLDNWLNAEREMIWRPSMELRKENNQFVLDIALPGVDPKKVDIEITPEEILMMAELRHEHTENEGEVHVCKFNCGNIFRSMRFPARVNPDRVKAEFENGMLTVTAEIVEEPRSKKLAIQAA
jgi:HSP20 family protein